MGPELRESIVALTSEWCSSRPPGIVHILFKFTVEHNIVNDNFSSICQAHQVIIEFLSDAFFLLFLIRTKIDCINIIDIIGDGSSAHLLEIVSVGSLKSVDHFPQSLFSKIEFP